MELTVIEHYCSNPRLCKGEVITTLPSGAAVIREWLLGNKAFGSEQAARDFAEKMGITIAEP